MKSISKSWPLLARHISRLRVAGEKGVGDTIARYSDTLGANVFKRVYRYLTGRNCGCRNRQRRLNEMFKYD